MLNNLPENIAFKYVLSKKIGEGANGETWLVNHKVNRIPAVLKFLRSLSNTDFKTEELFQREAELLKSIHVQGVPAFYDYTTDDQGNGYLIQEYIPYPSLQSMLDSKKIFGEQETLNIALRVAKIIERLQTEYTPAIIHRDIKPSNILYDLQSGQVWLIDFGAVAHPQKRGGGSTIAGTFGYMPPEQMLGEVALQSDYYALGATMLHIITGRFPGNMPSLGYQLDVESVLKEYAPKTTSAVKQLLISLLSADIDKRPKTAQLLCEAIQKAIVERDNGFMNKFRRMVRKWFSVGRQKNNIHSTVTKGKEIIINCYDDDDMLEPVFTHFAEGKIRKIMNYFDNDNCTIEYTFEVQGKTCCGKVSFVNTNFKYYCVSSGLKCKVRYFYFFPGNINRLYSIFVNSNNEQNNKECDGYKSKQ